MIKQVHTATTLKGRHAIDKMVKKNSVEHCFSHEYVRKFSQGSIKLKYTKIGNPRIASTIAIKSASTAVGITSMVSAAITKNRLKLGNLKGSL